MSSTKVKHRSLASLVFLTVQPTDHSVWLSKGLSIYTEGTAKPPSRPSGSQSLLGTALVGECHFGLAVHVKKRGGGGGVSHIISIMLSFDNT